MNLMKLKNKSKIKTKITRKKRKKKDELLSVSKFLDKYPNGKIDGYIPNLVQKPSETPKSFLNRMNEMATVIRLYLFYFSMQTILF